MNNLQHTDDSGFDWDALRPPAARPPKRHSQTTRLAWVVLVLLAFCPLAGFLLAHVWGG